MENYIGVGECLLISAVNGLIFALFAAQPLLIVGATGPLMIFDMSLYQVSILHVKDGYHNTGVKDYFKYCTSKSLLLHVMCH